MKSSQQISILRVLQVMCAALVLLIQSALAQTATHTAPSDLAVVPAQHGYVADTTGRLSAAERDSLISELKQLNASSGAQVFVLIVDHTDPEPIESYAQRVFTTWKPGRKGVDDGALLLIALNNKTKRLRLHTGYGLEGSVPDVSAKRLLANEVRPALESHGAYAAAMAGVVGVRDLLAKDATRQNSVTAVHAQPDKNAEIKLVGVVFAQIVPLVLVIMVLGRPRSRRLAAVVSVVVCLMVAAIYWLLRGDDGLSSLAAFFWLAIPVWLLLAFAGRTPKVSQSRTGMLPPIKQKDRASMSARQRRQRALAEKASRPVARVKARVPPGFASWLALAALALCIVGRIEQPIADMLFVMAGLFGCVFSCLMVAWMIRQFGGVRNAPSGDGESYSGDHWASTDSGESWSGSDSGGGDSGGGGGLWRRRRFRRRRLVGIGHPLRQL